MTLMFKMTPYIIFIMVFTEVKPTWYPNHQKTGERREGGYDIWVPLYFLISEMIGMSENWLKTTERVVLNGFNSWRGRYTWFFSWRIWIKSNLHPLSTIIKMKDVFTGILVRHPCLSRFLSLFAFGNTYPCLSQILNSFDFKNTKWIV